METNLNELKSRAETLQSEALAARLDAERAEAEVRRRARAEQQRQNEERERADLAGHARELAATMARFAELGRPPGYAAKRDELIEQLQAHEKYRHRNAPSRIDVNPVLDAWLRDLWAERSLDRQRWETLAAALGEMASPLVAIERNIVHLTNTLASPDDVQIFGDVPRQFEVDTQECRYVVRPGSTFTPALWAAIGGTVTSEVKRFHKLFGVDSRADALRMARGFEDEMFVIEQIGRKSFREVQQVVPLHPTEIMRHVSARQLWRWLDMEQAADPKSALADALRAALSKLPSEFDMANVVAMDNDGAPRRWREHERWWAEQKVVA